MMRGAMIVAGVLLLSACDRAPAPEQRQPAPRTEAAGSEIAPRRISLGYHCDDGSAIELRLFPEQGVAVLVRPGGTAELDGLQGPDGLRFGRPGLDVRGTALDVTIAEAGEPERRCVAG